MKLTAQEIENGMYEVIRLLLISNGYLPNALDFIGDSAGFEAAIQTIISSGKKIIYIENDGSYLAREALKENTILISKEDSVPSSTGTKSQPEYTYDPINTNYKKEITAEGLYDLQYRITSICYDTEYLGIMEDIIRVALGFRKKLNAINAAGEITGDFWCWVANYINLDSAKYIERAVMFNIPSVDLIGNQDAGVVARAEEILVGVSTNPDIEKDGEDDILTQTDVP